MKRNTTLYHYSCFSVHRNANNVLFMTNQSLLKRYTQSFNTRVQTSTPLLNYRQQYNPRNIL